MSHAHASTRLRLLGAVTLCLFPSVASAHTGLRRSEPARGARLNTGPTRIVLWFTAKPQLAFSRVRLAGPGGDVPLGALVADSGNSVRASIQAGTLAPGDYTVRWQTASADGHPIRGEFVFTVLAVGNATEPAPATPPAVGDSGAHMMPEVPAAESSEYRSVRWIEFVALLTILGVLGFRHGVLPPLAARGVPTADAGDRARRLGMSALVLYAVAAVVRLYTESQAVHGADAALDPTLLRQMLLGTTWGLGWLFGAMGALLLFAGWMVSRRSVAIGTPLALTGALGVGLAPALSGHAAASEHFVLSVVLDVLHVTAAGLWLGGLLIVLIAGIPAMRRLTNGNQDAAVSALVNSFHPLALFCAPLVILAGLGTAWIRLGAFSALRTEYGQNLIWKLVFVAVVGSIGLYNSTRARRNLGTMDATRRIRRTAAIEVAFAAIVLAITAALVTSPVPTNMLTP